MAIHVAQMSGIEDKKKVYDALTVNSAKKPWVSKATALRSAARRI